MDGQDQIYKGPNKTALRFYYAPAKNNFVSAREGRPIYDKALMVEVLTPGSNESAPTFELEREFCAEANIPAPRRSSRYAVYAEQIASFKANDETGALQGTPLTQWPEIDISLATTLKAQRIYTVQQLADVSDTSLRNLGTGGRTLRDKAKAWVVKGEGVGDTAAVIAELATAREEMDRMRAGLSEMNDKLTAVLAENAALKSLGSAPAPVSDPMDAPVQQPATGGKGKGALGGTVI